MARTYRLHIELDGIAPPIWREIEAPGDATLQELHHAIQTAMGWEGAHLWCFETPEGRFVPKGPFNFEDDARDAAGTTVEALVPAEPGTEFAYVYDFGDYWVHAIRVVEVTENEQSTFLLCAGARACPPEDCGGVVGYEDAVQVAQSKDPHFEAESGMNREWLGGWQPEDFDLADEQYMFEDIMFMYVEDIEQRRKGKATPRARTASATKPGADEVEREMPPRPKPRREPDRVAEALGKGIREVLAADGFHKDNIEWALDVWYAYYEEAQPRVAKEETWTAVMHYVAGWFLRDPAITQAMVCARHGISSPTMWKHSKSVRDTLGLKQVVPIHVSFFNGRFKHPRKMSYRKIVAESMDMLNIMKLFADAARS